MKKTVQVITSKMKQSYLSFWIGMFLLFSAVYLLWAVMTRGESLYRIFFRETLDGFMDFFNSIRDASQGTRSYTERHVIYPPMANMIFLLLSKLTPDAYNNASFDDRLTWVDYPSCVALIIGFVAVSMLLFGVVFYCSFQGTKKKKLLFAAVAALSVPLLSMLERGNIMVLAFLGLLIFSVTYHSEKAWVRELGILALAFSFSIKLYPILFAWILFADKRYAAFFRCAFYSVIFLILPSFAFDGPICLWWIVQNIFRFSGGGPGGVVGFMSGLTRTPQLLWTILLYIPFLCSTLSFLVAPYVFKERWKVWTLGCTMFVSYPVLASSYAWAVFLIPILFLVREGADRQWTDQKGWRHYLIWMTIPFLPFAISLAIIPAIKRIWDDAGPIVSFNNIIVYVCIIALAAIGTSQTVRCLVQTVKAKREGSDA